MVEKAKVKRLKRTVTLLVAVLFGAWFVINFSFLTNSQNGGVRFVLTVFFSLFILLRPKDGSSEDELNSDHEPMPMSWAVTGVAGVFLVLGGLVFRVNQVEWVGLLTLMYASLRWIMPARASKDIFLSLFLLYWAHPLPAQVFAPLQFLMQVISVKVSEWFMHIINVKVWADGMILRTGRNVYEIPAACSGLRTATTVFLLSIGLSIVRRFGFIETLLLVLAALVQAVFLNVLRITVMVTLVPKVGAGSGPQFLHDTAGFIVVAAVLIVFLEILVLDRIKRERELEKNDLSSGIIKGLSGLPSFWTFLVSRRGMVIVLILVAVLGTVCIYRSRSYHRGEMLKVVVHELREAGNLQDAERLAKEIIELAPQNIMWRFDVLRIMILDGEYQEVLDEIKKLPDLAKQELQMEKDVLEAYALTGSGRYKAAEKVLQRLPAKVVAQDPRAAMVLVELGMFSNNPELIRKHLALAAAMPENIRRIRALYPYMRSHKMWNEILLSDRSLDYEDIVQALCAAEAYMSLNDVPSVARVVLQCTRLWPQDYRLLTPVFFLALESFSPEWEDLFSEHLQRSVGSVDDPEKLNSLFTFCFRLRRPDLAWTVFRRIQEIDPEHPSLWLCVARFGDQWFRFRQHWLGLSAEEVGAEIDMKPMFLVEFSIRAWDSMLANVPLGRELCVENVKAVQKKYLDRALDEFRKRDKAETLTEAMRHEYMIALGSRNDTDAAVRQFKMAGIVNAEGSDRSKVILSEVYERKGAWPEVYELLKDYHRDADPRLEPLLRLFRAEIKLNQVLMAMGTASRAAKLFPDSSNVASALAEICLKLDMPEKALFVLNRNRTWSSRKIDMMKAEALWRTERYYLAESASRAAFMPPRPIPEDSMQKRVLPPAELSIMWHHLHLPSEEDFAVVAAAMRKRPASVKDGFFMKMNKLWLECYDEKCDGDSMRVNRWIACGDTNEEKATALSQLVLHLCRAEKNEMARNVAGMAVRFMPRSPILWRMLISLSDADRNVVNAARGYCPDDEEIWLADVVTSKDVDAVSAEKYTPAALTRAAEFLVRAGEKKKAVELMRHATPKAMGLLPVYIMGARCARFAGDAKWALQCTRLAIESSINPAASLYKKLVEIKAAGGQVEADTEMVNALTNLQEQHPDDPLWAEMLGYVRYSRGGGNILEAMYQMDAAIAKGVTSRQAFIVAAESARQLGNYEKAEELLEKAMKLYKGDISILNNYIYTLSMAPGRAGETAPYLPVFEKVIDDDPAMLDTLALAYIAVGKYDKAEKVIDKILSSVPESGAPWFRAKMFKAEIAIRLHMPKRANIMLQQILSKSKGVSNEDVLRANRLLEESGEMTKP